MPIDHPQSSVLQSPSSLYMVVGQPENRSCRSFPSGNGAQLTAWRGYWVEYFGQLQIIWAAFIIRAGPNVCF